MPAANVRRRGVGTPDLRDGRLLMPEKTAKVKLRGPAPTSHGAPEVVVRKRVAAATPIVVPRAGSWFAAPDTEFYARDYGCPASLASFVRGPLPDAEVTMQRSTRRRVVAAMALALVSRVAPAADTGSPPPNAPAPVSFRNDVVPLLSLIHI